MPHRQTDDSDRQEEAATNPNRRIRRAVVWLSDREIDLLKKNAAARGKGLGPYLRAEGLRQHANNSVYIELAREMLAVAHAIMEATSDCCGERERMLSRIRPVLKRISAHLP